MASTSSTIYTCISSSRACCHATLSSCHQGSPLQGDHLQLPATSGSAGGKCAGGSAVLQPLATSQITAVCLPVVGLSTPLRCALQRWVVTTVVVQTFRSLNERLALQYWWLSMYAINGRPLSSCSQSWILATNLPTTWWLSIETGRALIPEYTRLYTRHIQYPLVTLQGSCWQLA